MADNQLDATLEQPSEAEKRIKELSEKVKLTANERDEKDKLLQERDEKIATLERENTFNVGFVDAISQNPAAKDFKDDIKAKVMSGYSVEDATFAVLGKAGKLGASAQEIESPAGGSTVTNVTKTEKPANQLKGDELRAKLQEIDGEIGELLRPQYH